jgi:signal transduction histidine kinase
MTGTTTKSDFLDAAVEFSFFSGTEKEIFSHLTSHLEMLLGKGKFRLYRFGASASRADRSGALYRWVSARDECLHRFDLDELPGPLRTSLRVAGRYRRAVVIRRRLFRRDVRALVFTGECGEKRLLEVELLCALCGFLLEGASLFPKQDDFMKYYHLGRICPQVFHEIKNKLTAPSTFLQTFPARYGDRRFREEFSALCARELGFARGQIEKVLAHGRACEKESPPRPGAFSEMLSYCLALLEPELAKNRIRVIKRLASGVRVPLGELQLRDVLFNLVVNAIHALKKASGERTLEIREFQGPRGTGFSVSDNGRGMDAASLPRLFDPYFTTRSRGNGLGLCVVKQWVEAAGGDIRVRNRKKGGLAFRVVFPENG